MWREMGPPELAESARSNRRNDLWARRPGTTNPKTMNLTIVRCSGTRAALVSLLALALGISAACCGDDASTAREGGGLASGGAGGSPGSGEASSDSSTSTGGAGNQSVGRGGGLDASPPSESGSEAGAGGGGGTGLGGGGAGRAGSVDTGNARDGEAIDAADATRTGASEGGTDAATAARDAVARPATLRIMPLGDSTTASICYRSHLWQMLTAAGHTQFDFVGTRRGDPGCTFTAYDQDNEGHGGYVVSDVLKAAGTGVRPGGADTTDPFVSDSRDLATWLDGHPADVVIMHFGTNDVWNSAAISSQRLQMILMAYDAILARLRANNPNVRLFVAQITPLAPAGCSTCTANARALDDLIPGWASANTHPESPVSVVDQFTGFVPAIDTVDGVHSNDSGSIKIATNWFNALVPLF